MIFYINEEIIIEDSITMAFAQYKYYLYKSLIILTIVVLISIIISYIAIDHLLEYSVSNFISRVTHTNTTIENTDFSLWRGQSEFTNLVVANPKNFSTSKNLLAINNLNIIFKPWTVMQQKVIMPLLQVKDFVLNYEILFDQKHKKIISNLEQIKNNIHSYHVRNNIDNEKVIELNKGKQLKKQGKYVEISVLEIQRPIVNIYVNHKFVSTVHIANINLHNIGTNRLITFNQVVSIIFANVIDSAQVKIEISTLEFKHQINKQFDKISKQIKQKVNKLIDLFNDNK